MLDLQALDDPLSSPTLSLTLSPHFSSSPPLPLAPPLPPSHLPLPCPRLCLAYYEHKGSTFINKGSLDVGSVRLPCSDVASVASPWVPLWDGVNATDGTAATDATATATTAAVAAEEVVSEEGMVAEGTLLSDRLLMREKRQKELLHKQIRKRPTALTYDVVFESTGMNSL